MPMRPRLLPAVLAAAVLIAAAPATAAPPTAREWLTTPDGAFKLSDSGSLPLRPGGSDRLTLTVKPSRSYQTMDGFGASITDSSAQVLYRLDPRTRDATMQRLFGPPGGAPFLPP